MQTGLIQNAHDDLVTDAAYDFYGLHLATCSLDQRSPAWPRMFSDLQANTLHPGSKCGSWTKVQENGHSKMLGK
jgi:hypothetical protein